jgi:serine/threonine protein kinase/Tol biopolymer transport system component
MPLTAGSRLGPYEILSPIGAGGMGEVYKARDTRLDRVVAVKIPAQQVTERFVQEARAVAALNHPNIVALYDVGENYIVTELVDGEPLRSAQLTPRRAIEVSAQVADGLAAAHAAGIAHRDLKPENVMVTRDGRAKILDFGLSRQYAGAAAVDQTRTLPGTVMGTVGYMSPEQVRGQEADHRSDIFSFGAVLYELLSGRRAFSAETSAEVMTAILKQDPPDLPPSVPATWAEIARHCLEKEPVARFQSAKDLSFALRSSLVQSTTSGAVPAIPEKRSPRWILLAGIAAAVIAAFGAGWFANRGRSTDLSNYRFTPIASEAVAETEPAWSPDGKSLAYAAVAGRYTQIFTRRLDSPVPDQITHEGGNCRSPVWSPKGDRIYYIKATATGIGIWSIAAIGGAAQKVLDNADGMALAPDGVSVAIALPREGFSLGKLGGELTPYRKPPFDHGLGVRTLRFSPDGSKLAVLLTRINSTEGEIWLVPYPAERGSPRELFTAAPKGTTFSGLSWMPDSRNLVVASIRSDEPPQLYLGDSENGSLRKLTSGMSFNEQPAVSPDGQRIAFAQHAEAYDLLEITLDGSVRTVLNTARSETSGAWLPKGREFVYTSNANGPFDLWVRNPEDNRARPLLPQGHDVLPPGELADVAVAPDGERIAFVAWSAEHTAWVLRPSGGKAVRLDPENPDHHSPSWSPDGNWIAYARVLPRAELMKAPAGGGTPVVIASSDQSNGPTDVAWSPTGDWVAWAADTLTLYSPDGKLTKKLSERRLHEVVGFSPDGKTLYACYLESRSAWALDAFDVASGKPRRLASFELDGRLYSMRVHPDGKRCLAALERSNPDIVMLEGFGR